MDFTKDDKLAPTPILISQPLPPHVVAAVFQCVVNTIVPVCLSRSVVCKRSSIVPEGLESCFISEATSLQISAAK